METEYYTDFKINLWLKCLILVLVLQKKSFTTADKNTTLSLGRALSVPLWKYHEICTTIYKTIKVPNGKLLTELKKSTNRE